MKPLVLRSLAALALSCAIVTVSLGEVSGAATQTPQQKYMSTLISVSNTADGLFKKFEKDIKSSKLTAATADCALFQNLSAEMKKTSTGFDSQVATMNTRLVSDLVKFAMECQVVLKSKGKKGLDAFGSAYASIYDDILNIFARVDSIKNLQITVPAN